MFKKLKERTVIEAEALHNIEWYVQQRVNEAVEASELRHEVKILNVRLEMALKDSKQHRDETAIQKGKYLEMKIKNRELTEELTKNN